MTDPGALLGPLDALGPYVEILLVVLVGVNVLTRLLADRSYREQAGTGLSLTRYLPHEVSNVLLVLTSFYYLTYDYHAGMVLSVLVVSLVVVDFFEFEARAVEARRDDPLERPKAALVGSALVLGYVLYTTVFFVVRPIWDAIV
jgi:hypothetical protein